MKQTQSKFEQAYCLKYKKYEEQATANGTGGKQDKSTNTNMNGSPALSASPPPAPPPLPISVRANYCARCRFNIAHSRHDLNAPMPNGTLRTGGGGANNYGIPQTGYTGKL